jgi:hypothetical protein
MNDVENNNWFQNIFVSRVVKCISKGIAEYDVQFEFQKGKNLNE